MGSARRACVCAASVLVACVGGLGAGGAVAAPDTAVVAGPGSARTGQFSTAAMAVRVGDRPLLVNADVSPHGIESAAVGADDRPWCGLVDPSKQEGPANPRLKPLGQCPLFWADWVSTGGTSPVLGLEGVESGRVYAYRCTVVPGMTGNLFVF